jgi:hypothetical protein
MNHSNIVLLLLPLAAIAGCARPSTRDQAETAWRSAASPLSARAAALPHLIIKGSEEESVRHILGAPTRTVHGYGFSNGGSYNDRDQLIYEFGAESITVYCDVTASPGDWTKRPVVEALLWTTNSARPILLTPTEAAPPPSNKVGNATRTRIPQSGARNRGRWWRLARLPVETRIECRVEDNARKKPDIGCRAVSVELRSSDVERGALTARVHLQLTSVHSRIKAYPYADMAFEILPAKEHSVVVLPRPALRPEPLGGRERQPVVLTKEPTSLNVDLTDSYLIKPMHGSEKGTPIEFYVRYFLRGHHSNYILIKGSLP